MSCMTARRRHSALIPLATLLASGLLLTGCTAEPEGTGPETTGPTTAASPASTLPSASGEMTSTAGATADPAAEFVVTADGQGQTVAVAAPAQPLSGVGPVDTELPGALAVTDTGCLGIQSQDEVTAVLLPSGTQFMGEGELTLDLGGMPFGLGDEVMAVGTVRPAAEIAAQGSGFPDQCEGGDILVIEQLLY